MTREERLKKYLEERNIPITSLEANSILEGIEWADENPRDELVSIDKVCKWLRENIDFYADIRHSIVSGHQEIFLLDFFELDFRKKMKE